MGTHSVMSKSVTVLFIGAQMETLFLAHIKRVDSVHYWCISGTWVQWTAAL